jgi:hypothetical protein
LCGQSLDSRDRKLYRDREVYRADQTTIVRQSQVKFALQDPAETPQTSLFFGQVKFETAGIYYVEVLVDDIMKLRFPCQYAS